MADIIIKKIRTSVILAGDQFLETKGWLKESKTRKLLNDEQFDLLYEKLQTIHLKLNAYLKFIGKSGNRSDQ
jgi:hypothetical protein